MPVRFAILIPVYNHREQAAKVIAQVAALRSRLADPASTNIFVIDDGSTDGGPEIPPTLANAVTLLRHETNRGKGAALQTGFAHALSLGFTHAVTIDSDGQHHVPDAESLMAAANTWPGDLIIGSRDLSGPNVPESSRKGQTISRFWLKLHAGADVPDSQCGLRVYPLAAVTAIHCWFSRYDFETEILARLSWAGLEIRSVPVRCIYFSGADRVTHFRPLADNVRGVRMNVALVLRRLLPIPAKKLRPHPTALEEIAHKGVHKKTLRAAARELLASGASNAELAAAVGIGVFIGVVPIYLFQTILALYVGRRLHLNLPAILLGTQVSIPPLMPVWCILGLQTGHLILHGSWVPLGWHQAAKISWQAYAGSLFFGCFLWGILLGAAAILITRGLLGRFRTTPAPAAAA